MGKIINGKKIAEKILEKTAKRVALLKKKKIIPKLAVVLVGNDKPSQTYVRKKGEMAQKINIDFVLHKYPEKITMKKLTGEIAKIQADKKLTGLIVQLPLPKRLNTDKILNIIEPKIDVDCLTYINSKKIARSKLLPPTPTAILTVLKKLKINLKNKKIVLVGYGRLVGKPLALILKNRNIKFKICTSKTKNLKKYCLWADVIITAVGRVNLITDEMVKKGAIVIDAGVSFDKNGKMQGDVNVEQVRKKARWVTPTPGGIGPVTVAKLLENVVRGAKI